MLALAAALSTQLRGDADPVSASVVLTIALIVVFVVALAFVRYLAAKRR